MKFKGYFIGIACILIGACRPGVSFDKVYNERIAGVKKMHFSIDILDSGKMVSSKEKAPNDQVAIVVGKILQDKRGTWKISDRISYVPRILLTTTGMSLNVREDVVVLNIEITGGNWKQYITASNREQFTALMDIVTTIK